MQEQNRCGGKRDLFEDGDGQTLSKKQAKTFPISNGIVQDGAEILREIAEPVPKELFGSRKLSRLIAEMSTVLDKEPEGIALAAPQVGVSWRLFIVRVDRTLPSQQLGGSTAKSDLAVEPPQRKAEIEVYINPEIIKTSRKRAEEEEGCLSVRGVFGKIERHERVTISARRPDGSLFTRGAGGLLAQIFEHEMDHLNGILFTDHAIIIEISKDE